MFFFSVLLVAQRTISKMRRFWGFFFFFFFARFLPIFPKSVGLYEAKGGVLLFKKSECCPAHEVYLLMLGQAAGTQPMQSSHRHAAFLPLPLSTPSLLCSDENKKMSRAFFPPLPLSALSPCGFRIRLLPCILPTAPDPLTYAHTIPKQKGVPMNIADRLWRHADRLWARRRLREAESCLLSCLSVSNTTIQIESYKR